MSKMMSETIEQESTLVFDRTPLARLVSCTAVVGSMALFFLYLSQGTEELQFFPLAGLVLLVVGTFLAALLQYGDHIYVSPEGLLYYNKLLPIMNRRGGWMRWDEVVEIREVRRKVLIILSRDGRKLPVDAIFGYPIARREILKRAPHAVISGTLRQEDRG